MGSPANNLPALHEAVRVCQEGHFISLDFHETTMASITINFGNKHPEVDLYYKDNDFWFHANTVVLDKVEVNKFDECYFTLSGSGRYFAFSKISKNSEAEVHIYKRKLTDWEYSSVLYSPDESPLHSFGTHLSFDKTDVLAVSEPLNNQHSSISTGVVYLYKHQYGDWKMIGILRSPYVKVRESFGDQVKISQNLNWIAVSTENKYQKPAGIYLYQFNPASLKKDHLEWQYRARILPTPLLPLSNVATKIVFSNDGTKLFIGQVFKTSNEVVSEAYLYKLIDSVWTLMNDWQYPLGSEITDVCFSMKQGQFSVSYIDQNDDLFTSLYGQ